MKRILITGGAGFIGSNLADLLLKNNNQIIVIDNFDNYYQKRFKKENIKKTLINENYTFINANINNFNKIESIVKNSSVDSIVHLAARAGVRPSIDNPLIYQKINIEGTYNLLHLSVKYKIKQFIFISSSSVYGNAPIPFSETYQNLTPLSPYGITKLSGEQACKVFAKCYKLPVTILRLFSVYGPRGRPDMAPYLFTKAIYSNKTIQQYGNGSSARDWTYIDDITDGIKKTIEKPFQFEIINLGGNHPVTLKRLIDIIQIITKRKIKRKILPKKAEESLITYADAQKARRLLNWRPKTNLEQGLKRFINWFKNNRLDQRITR